jgi:hypothetical protein
VKMMMYFYGKWTLASVLFAGSVRSQPTIGSRSDAGGMVPDDDVLLANSDEEFPSDASPERVLQHYMPDKVYNLDGSPNDGGPEDMVLVEEEHGDAPSFSWAPGDQEQQQHTAQPSHSEDRANADDKPLSAPLSAQPE